MIAWLEGTLREKAPTRIVVDVQGVGYELLVSLNSYTALPDEGKTVALHVHTHVREEAIQLFGFTSPGERDVFELSWSLDRRQTLVDLDDVTGGGGRIENMVEIRILLDGLDPERREALVLTQVLGMTYAEAAEVCGCPVGTIRSRVARARDDLLRAAAEDDRAG